MLALLPATQRDPAFLRWAMATLTRECGHRDQYNNIDDTIEGNGQLGALIQRYRTPDGMIWVAESGMDCDGVQYQGSAYQIPATAAAFWAKHQSIAEWADGPFSLHICDPDDLPEAWSFDRTLAAYEDGHPHSI